MPWVHKTKRPHVCSRPLSHTLEEHNEGDRWKCWRCKKVYEVVMMANSFRLYLTWEEVTK